MKVKAFLIIVLLVAIGYALFTRVSPVLTVPSSSFRNQDLGSVTEEPVSYEASFEIYTNGTKRIFTASMYHNLSGRVYITKDNPSVVNVKAPGVTWGEFFETLPMELTRGCLVTGTGQRFCDGEGGSLEFYSGGELTPELLEKAIEEREKVLITFTSY